jgi:hypothetical protein
VLADAEPDRRLKANYAGLALIFASAAGRKDIWKKALEGWNVIESSVVNEWKAEEAVVSVITILEAKFGQILPEVEAAIRRCSDLAKLRAWTKYAATAATLDEFRAAAGL